MTPAYWNPTRRVIADGALAQLPQAVADFGASRILLVMGARWFRGSPFYAACRQHLAGSTVVEAPPVRSQPTVEQIAEAAGTLRRRAEGFDLVVGIGGGSVLDVGKLLAALLSQRRDVSADDLERGVAFEEKPLPFIALPTTAGTGSEVTPFASVTTRAQKKITLEHPWLFPQAAVIDPLLTHSMSPYITACTGFDALSQAIESFWALRHTPFSDTHALRAVALVLEHLESAVRTPLDRGARFALSLAASEAGLAISQTRTTAVHAVSYPFTALFGISHGHACALTLASFIRYNVPALAGDRGVALWHAMGVSSSDAAAERIERLMERVGLERSLSRLGIDEAGLDRVVEDGFRPDRVGNNPKELTHDALREILQAIY